jgi:CRISPR-associated protein Cas1
MILTLHVPGTTVKRVQETLKIYVPPMQRGNTLGEQGETEALSQEKEVEPNDAATASGDSINQASGTDGVVEEADPLVDSRGHSFQVSVSQLTSVVVSGNIGMTIPVLLYLAKQAVPVIFTDRNKPVALLNPFAPHGSVRVRKEQFSAIEGPRGFHIAAHIVWAGLENKARILLGLAKNRAMSNPGISTQLREAATTIRAGQDKLAAVQPVPDPVANRFKLMGIEGDGAKIYFGALQLVIPSQFLFSGRNRRPPRDPVNAMLSLGYAILQGYVNVGIAAVGLEPYAGFLHADRSGKPSLVLDMMEEFRQATVDRFVITMTTKGIIKPTHFTNTATGVELTEAGKNIFIPRLIKRLAPLRPDEEAKATDHNYYKDIIGQARLLSRFLLGLAPEYTPHVVDW